MNVSHLLILFLWVSAPTGMAPTPMQSLTVPTIQVPVLVNPVSIDARISSSSEWSDASKSELTLSCFEVSCSGASVETLASVIWAKHDDRWLYLLYQVAYPARNLICPDCPEAYVKYCLANRNCDMGYVGIGDRGATYAGDWWFPQGRCCYNDLDQPGGQNNVIGLARYDGGSYWFEFKKLLDSGDGYDWVLKPQQAYGSANTVLTLAFGSGNDAPRWATHVVLALCPCQTALTSVETTTSAIMVSVTTSSTSGVTQQVTSIRTSEAQPFFALGSFMTFGVAGVILAVSILSVLLVMRRKMPVQKSLVGIATGYSDLDELMAGGLPLDYVILIISPPCDEKDLLLRRIIHATISSGASAFYVTSDVRKAQDFAVRHEKAFFAYCAAGDHLPTQHENLFMVPPIGNLSEFNIVLNQSLAVKTIPSQRKVMVVDVFSDILFQYKPAITRKWLSEFISKRKASGFTIVATLNPYVAKEDVQAAIVDMFDGIIEIYEKRLKEKPRRFLTIKKLYGRRYSQKEILLDMDKLWIT